MAHTLRAVGSLVSQGGTSSLDCDGLLGLWLFEFLSWSGFCGGSFVASKPSGRVLARRWGLTGIPDVLVGRA